MELICYTCRAMLPIASFQPDPKAEGSRKYSRRCRDCQRVYHREWSRRNRDKVEASKARAAEKAPHQKHNWMHAYRARKAGVESTLTVAECDAVFAAFGGCCAYCGASARPGKVGQITLDHMVPMERGGSHSIENVVPACWGCNASKKDMTPLEWILYSLTPSYCRDYQRRTKAKYLGGGERHIPFLTGAGCT
jgi:5-methylcytosine-specific restriction endonuclease McrA